MRVSSVYTVRECVGCGANILGDSRKPLSLDPVDHEDDCPMAEPYPDEDDIGSISEVTIDQNERGLLSRTKLPDTPLASDEHVSINYTLKFTEGDGEYAYGYETEPIPSEPVSPLAFANVPRHAPECACNGTGLIVDDTSQLANGDDIHWSDDLGEVLYVQVLDIRHKSWCQDKCPFTSAHTNITVGVRVLCRVEQNT